MSQYQLLYSEIQYPVQLVRGGGGEGSYLLGTSRSDLVGNINTAKIRKIWHVSLGTMILNLLTIVLFQEIFTCILTFEKKNCQKGQCGISCGYIIGSFVVNLNSGILCKVLSYSLT